jgi:hypothetical protein
MGRNGHLLAGRSSQRRHDLYRPGNFLGTVMRHFLLSVHALPVRVTASALSTSLVSPAGGAQRREASVPSAAKRAVACASVAGAAQEEDLSAARQRTDDEA